MAARPPERTERWEPKLFRRREHPPLVSTHERDLVVSGRLTPGDPLYQKDRNELPVTRDAVIAIALGPPASSLRVRRLPDGRSAVATGRQRTKAALVANAIGAGVACCCEASLAVKAAIAEFKKDPEFAERVTGLMRNRPIRLAALAANADIASVRGMIATENALAQAESKRAVIAAIQEDVRKYDIPVALVAEQRGLTVGQVNRMLKVDLSAPAAKPKTRGKTTRPSAKVVKAVVAQLETGAWHRGRSRGARVCSTSGDGRAHGCRSCS